MMAPIYMGLAYKSFLCLDLTVLMCLLQKAARAAATVFPRGRCTSCRPVAAAWAQRGLDRPERTPPSSGATNPGAGGSLIYSNKIASLMFLFLRRLLQVRRISEPLKNLVMQELSA